MKLKAVASAALVAVILAFSAAAQGSILTPTAYNGYTPFSGSFPLSRSVDNTTADYASAGGGVNTFLEFDFGSAVTVNRVLPITRNSGAGNDRFASVTYTFSTDAAFGGADPSQSFATLSAAGVGAIQTINNPTAARYARFDVDTLAGGGASNTGALELIFLATPAGSQIATPSIAAASTAYNAGFVASKLQDSAAGTGYEYASAASGTATFVDFDFGVRGQRISGFDYIDRIVDAAKVSGFNMLFSNDPTFASGVTTRSYSKGAAALFVSDAFAPIEVRYVRFDVTALATGITAVGGSEFVFYAAAVPEPSTFAMAALGFLGAAGVCVRKKFRRA